MHLSDINAIKKANSKTVFGYLEFKNENSFLLNILSIPDNELILLFSYYCNVFCHLLCIRAAYNKTFTLKSVL